MCLEHLIATLFPPAKHDLAILHTKFEVLEEWQTLSNCLDDPGVVGGKLLLAFSR